MYLAITMFEKVCRAIKKKNLRIIQEKVADKSCSKFYNLQKKSILFLSCDAGFTRYLYNSLLILILHGITYFSYNNGITMRIIKSNGRHHPKKV